MDHIRRISMLEAGIGTLTKDTEEIKATVHRIDKAIRGYNDKLGLMARTASLEESRDEHEVDQTSNRRWLRGVFAAAILAAVGAGLRLAFG
jgi:hypothetical protein